MRFLPRCAPPLSAAATAAALLFLSTAPRPSLAKPYPKPQSLVDEFISLQNDTVLAARQGCANPCGWAGQLCCGSDQQCYTDANNQAQCANGGSPVTAADDGDGYWMTVTTTWVETDLVTRTSVYSTFVGYNTPQPTASCNEALSEQPCGNVCCSSGEYCKLAGQCAPAAGGSSVIQSTTPPTQEATPPLRPTSSTLIIVTATGGTQTSPFGTPVPTGTAGTNATAEPATGGGGLSGGEIAGIVIGVLVGILLLILLCICCCFKTVWDSFMAIFRGGRRRRRTETEYVEEHHHGVSPGAHSRWYGSDRPSRVERRRRGGRWGNMGALAGGLGALALALGLKRRHDRRRHDDKSDYSSTYYSSDYTTSSSGQL
ncbi:hypothetical protein BDY21DRAFT_370398 [Lineolata rhizophorae]|uniref:Mid2 domain-containing protein n=1 Tax=Lineolata rhizophorae TaxID=578093 RepID=A0A6A6P5Y6_9PEZI|nr:hypothetical protein BDY21DRAFT_370398 [Lineolata rhizophorae]